MASMFQNQSKHIQLKFLFFSESLKASILSVKICYEDGKISSAMSVINELHKYKKIIELQTWTFNLTQQKTI